MQQAFANWKKELIESKLLQIEKTRVEELKEIFIQEFTSNEIMRKVFDTKGFDHPLVVAARHKYLSNSLLTEEENSINHFKQKIWKLKSTSS